MSKQSLFAGIDIGSNSVRVAIGYNVAGSLRLVGYGEVLSRGVKRGVIINPRQVSDCVAVALEQAERMSGKKISEAVANINGSHVLIGQVDSSVAIDEGHRVEPDDVNELFDVAAERGKQPNSEILQIFAQGYLVDGVHTKNPVGLHCSSLASMLSIITASAANIEMLDTALAELDVYVSDKTLTAIASGQIVLSDVQNETGAVIIDIGYYTSNIAVFEDGDLVSAKVLPIGSAQVTNDLAIGLKMSIDQAEHVKRNADVLSDPEGIDPEADLVIDVDPDNGAPPLVVPQQLAMDIARARTEELFEMCREFILEHSHVSNLAGGVALVGGGAKQQSIAGLASEVLDLPVFVAHDLIGVTGFSSDSDEIQSQAIPSIALMSHHAMIVQNNIQASTKPKRKLKKPKVSSGGGQKYSSIKSGGSSAGATFKAAAGAAGKTSKWMAKRLSGKK